MQEVCAKVDKRVSLGIAETNEINRQPHTRTNTTLK